MFQTGFITGDPTILGWTISAIYPVAASLCFRNKPRKLEAGSQHYVGLAYTGVFALGLNKQLDLQTSINALRRQLAGAIGWYGNRRELQLFFCVAVFVGTGVYLSRNFHSVNRFMRDKLLLAIGNEIVATHLLLRTTLLSMR